MNTADEERLNTWATEIAADVLPADTKWRDEGTERRFLGHGGLCINLKSAAWYCHSSQKGGVGVLSLLHFLRDSFHSAPLEFATAWLASHEGFGSCGAQSEN